MPETATTPPEAGQKSHVKEPQKRGFSPLRAVRAAVRNAPWFVIAVVAHVVLGAVLSVVYITTHRKDDSTSATTVAVRAEDAKTEAEPEIKTPEAANRDVIPKPRNEAAEVTASDVELSNDLTPPDPNAKEDLTQEAGDPSAPSDLPDSAASGGTAIGVGAGGGHHGTGRPSPFVSRTPPKAGDSGVARGRQAGATQHTELSILLGERWLLRHQGADGSWSAAALPDLCEPKCTCEKVEPGQEISKQFDVGLTSLSLLAFLGNGYAHDAKQTMVDVIRGKRYYLGECILKGLKWLKAQQDSHADGRFSADGFMYNEALATLAMSEAYAMAPHKFWKECAQKGVNFLVAAQRRSPTGGPWGWRYEPRSWMESDAAKQAFADMQSWQRAQSEADISVTGWVVMALKSAELAGLDVPPEAMQGAVEFVKFVTVKDGRVAYVDPRQVGMKISGEGDQFDHHAATLAALGMCVRTFATKDVEDPMLALGAEQLLKDLPAVSKNKLSVDYYYWYYGSLALYQFDGPESPKRTNKYWGPWNRAMQDTLLALQDDTPKSCQNGSWPTPDRWSYAGGPIYRTALNVLTLEVYFRYENAFVGIAKKK